MPVSIYEYVENHFPSVWSASTLNAKRESLRAMMVKMRSYPPTLLDTRASEYFSDIYSQKLAEGEDKTHLMHWMIEKIFYPISLTSTDTKARIAFWGDLPTIEEQAKRLFLVHNALSFSLTGLGNCATRSSYAAIQLFNIFENSGLQIEFLSFVEIDQFVLRIKNNKNEYKIYDPLTNPELIFNEDEYNQKIRPLFNPVPIKKRPFDLVVDEKSIRQYAFKNNTISQFLEKERAHTTVDLLKADPNYSSFLTQHNITDPEYKKTQTAYDELCDLLCWERTPAAKI